ncbi:MAG: DNA polymerase III subunit alpha, partial [Candidatus Pacebacteria bacterium]|nr:DNA polymerase III subunit alpha [Candidatus Paceibacterota bacterium]
RDEVIEYVAQKYGRDKVSQIITFGTMAARMVIRDVGRALQYPYGFCDQLAKLIPFGYSLEKTLAEIKEFQQAYNTDEKAKTIIDFSKKLEGVARHVSTHACGVVISKNPLTEYVPLQHPTQGDNNIVTQYEMHAIEDLGFLKMDFLGLKNLTIIEDTLARIYVVQGKKIDIEKIPENDKNVFDLFRKAETTGIFQLESEGMKRYLKELKPTRFEDIEAMIALYRPGPMELIPAYIKRKHKKETINYIHPKLKPILENTYGIILYQEQLMKIAQELAGFSLQEADVLRKAVGKKIKELLDSLEEKFIKGCIKNKINEKIAKQIWEWILPFASYGFNKSHSCSYAKIAYQTAYLKACFPVEFMASLLTSEKTNIERIAFLIQETEKMKIKVLPPSVNESLKNFTVVPRKREIRFGLLAIKNVGENITEVIVQERKNGKFISIADFVQRIGSKNLNKKSLESLIKSGALDCFGPRNIFLYNLERLLESAREHTKLKENGQTGLFDGKKDFNNKIILEKAEPIKKTEQLKWEKELLGLYVSSSPLEGMEKLLSKKCFPINKITHLMINRSVILGGIIDSIKKIITKKGQTMLFVKFQDLTGKIEIICFPDLCSQSYEILQEGKIVFLKGKISKRNGDLQIIAESLEEIINKE